MGKGPTIQELAERDSEFRDYLSQIRGELESDKAKETKELEATIEKFYKDGGWSYSPLMTTDKVEVQQSKYWNLDNVKSILGSIRDAIFTSSSPPEGVDINKSTDFDNALGALGNFQLYALNKAFGAIEGILTTFATESSYQGKSISKSELVAPGMMLFLTIRSDSWQNKNFFGGDKIVQYLFILRCNFSLEQAGDISKLNDLLYYEKLKESWRARIDILSEEIQDPKNDFSTVKELVQQQDFYIEQLTNIQATIDELHRKKMKDIKENSRRALQMRMRRA
jgi:hypothetical protein